MRGAFTLIDADALAHNARELRSRVGDFYCVLKCDAYGHGAVKCAELLFQAGMRRFAVYSLDEAMQIRKAAVDSEILILGRTEPKFCGETEACGFIQTVSSHEYARELASQTKKIKIHIEIDCGMNRSGFKAGELFEHPFPFPKDNIVGAFGHLSCADEKDITEASRQAKYFSSAADELEKRLGKPVTRHLSASAASLRDELRTKSLSRIGLALYGVAPQNCDGRFLRPVMSFYSAVTEVRRVKKGENVGYGLDHPLKRDSVIATVCGGYANGIHRFAGDRLAVMIQGETALSVGRICMDRFMADVTDIEEKGKTVRAGDMVTFFDENFGIENMALACGTIPYEILTSVGSQNRRVYKNVVRP